MHILLEKLLKKRGIQDASKLSGEEAQTFDRWNVILSDGEISVDKIRQFCESQIHLIETQWKDRDNSTQKNERLIVLYTVYRSLVDLISAPMTERETLEKYLQQLLTMEDKMV